MVSNPLKIVVNWDDYSQISQCMEKYQSISTCNIHQNSSKCDQNLWALTGVSQAMRWKPSASVTEVLCWDPEAFPIHPGVISHFLGSGDCTSFVKPKPPWNGGNKPTETMSYKPPWCLINPWCHQASSLVHRLNPRRGPDGPPHPVAVGIPLVQFFPASVAAWLLNVPSS